MKSFETINSTHILGLDILPNEGDIAIVSIDNAGTPGMLNRLVLKEYGYTEKDLPSRDRLGHGFSQIPAEKRKAILFVVTVNGRNTSENLEKNLYNTLMEFGGWFKGKKLWIPLMGTGSGGLTLEESYSITVKTINEFQRNTPTETTILLSIPNNPEGKELINQIREPKAKENIDVDAESFVKEFKGKFYLVGSIWNREDQLTRFFEEGIWEKGHEDESYSRLISQVKKNDILIVKSSYQSNSISYLRVKAFGIVIGSSEDGATLSVDWRIKNISVDIENLGFYRNTIQEASLGDVTIILSRVDKDSWKGLVPISVINPKKITDYSRKSSGFNNEFIDERPEDKIGITEDVQAFAALVAYREVKPPLAIGLFGNWGSGKSFFMRKLKSEINDLANDDSYSGFCKNILHIEFNAWHYSDANLWASMILNIFNAIEERGKASGKEKDVKELLYQKIATSKEQIKVAEARKDAATEEKTKAEDRIKSVYRDKTKILGLLKGIGSNYFSDLLIENKNRAIHELNKELDKTGTVLSEDVTKSLLSINTSWKRFSTSLFQQKSLTLILICISLAFIAYFSTHLVSLAKVDGIFAALAILINKFHLKYIVPIGLVITPFIKILAINCRRLSKVFKEVSEYSETYMASQRKELEEQLRVIEEQEKNASERLQQAEVKLKETEIELQEIKEGRKLLDFVKQRSFSDDYQKHLGIMSVIRKDLETLKNELKLVEEESPLKIERIVLYIDDLDRCPEDKVIEVLEAIHLLLAMDMFIVVVGVDPRWVSNALERKYSGFISEMSIKGEQKVSTWNYLEKIFQIPFVLNPVDKQGAEKLLDHLFEGTIEKQGGNDGTPQKFLENLTDLTMVEETENKKVFISYNSNTDTSSSEKIKKQLEEKITMAAQAVKISQEEVDFIKVIAPIIGTTPRTIKRYVNVYRILRAHAETPIYSNDKLDEFKIIMLLLALVIGNANLASKFFDSLQSSELKSIKHIPSRMVDFKASCINCSNFSPFQNFINTSEERFISLPLEEFSKRVPLVSRFSYGTI